jgi:integrase
MGCISRDARLETREARLRLKRRHQPYWQQIHQGLYIGYRNGKWLVRRLVGRTYRWKTIGIADDYKDSNGVDVLSFAEASRKAHEVSDELARIIPSGAYTVAHAIEDYLEWYKHNGRSEGEREKQSYQKTKSVAEKHIIPALGDRPVVELETQELRDWRDELARNGEDEATRSRKATVNRITNVLKAALNFVFTEKDDVHLPSDQAWRRLKPYKNVSSAKVRWLTERECGRLLAACPHDFRTLVHTALVTGARYGELRAMHVENYEAADETLWVRTGKTGRRDLYLTEEGIELLDELTAGRSADEFLFLRGDGKPWEPTQQVRRMRAACETANINPPIGFHILRHCFGSHLAMRGVPLQVIAQALGHSDTRMVEKHYGHLSPSYIKNTIRESLPRFSPITQKFRRKRR